MSRFTSSRRSKKIRDLFDAIVELDPGQRRAYLDRASSDDVALRAELESLLTANDERATGMRQILSHLPLAPHDVTVKRPVITRRETRGLTGHRVSHYEVQKMIGGGGMGEVYKALDTRLGRTVALKFLPLHLCERDKAKARFIHEAKSASALDHTNICTIFEIDETESGQLFIAMAFYEGETLENKIAGAPLPLDEVLDYVSQVASGLASAHEAGIIHRDIKPANIIVTDRGEVKIVDFGLAKVIEQAGLTKTGTMVGTVAYMSPEQAYGDTVDGRTDIWSLGVVCYEMLTGERPFRGDYEQAVIYNLLNTDPEPIMRLSSDLPREIEHIVNKCLQKGKENRYQTAADLLIEVYHAKKQIQADIGTKQTTVKDERKRSRIFISYKHNVGDDDRVAGEINAALSKHHDVFFDKLLVVGTRWVEIIESELARADFLIVLLSTDSIHSEMVLAEIEMAHQLALEQNGRPVILPVRLNYLEPFTYPLSAYLDSINWASWMCHEDTPRLIDDLQKAISGDPLVPITPSQSYVSQQLRSPSIPMPVAAAQPIHLEMPEGTMSPQSAYYVERPTDNVALSAIVRPGVTITIKGPRQMGKSSLLMRMIMAAKSAGKEVVFLDFQLFEHTALRDADTFFHQFCAWISDELDIVNQVETYWQRPLGNSQRCTRYMSRHILKTLGKPLVLAMDEVERVFDSDFRSDFFSMLRSWHNDRAIKPIWKELDLALVTSTEPYQLIENLNQSPFNVGEIIELGDFSLDQVIMLERMHKSSLAHSQLQQLTALIGGHPYLIRKALYLLAARRITVEGLLSTATDERGPFGDHLRHHLFRLQGQKDLIAGFRRILSDSTCEDEGVFWRLRGAGLVQREGSNVVPRCQLYADYFRVRFDV